MHHSGLPSGPQERERKEGRKDERDGEDTCEVEEGREGEAEV